MISDPCQEPAPPELRLAAGLFAAGEYFACHEVLETLWLAEVRPVRRLYQGILQVAVALHHAERDNTAGARKLLARAVEHLRPFAPACQGADVAALLEDAGTLLAALERGEAAGFGGFRPLRVADHG